MHFQRILEWNLNLSEDQAPSLLLFNALQTPPFRSIKLRNRKPACAACGLGAKTQGMIDATDYVQFCGGPLANWVERGLVPGSVGTRISTKVRSTKEIKLQMMT